MDPSILAFALAAGLVAAFNPCGFAMLPAYLALVVLGDGEHYSRARAVSRALLASATMAAGFLLVFGAFGLVVSPLASQVQQYLPVITVVIGVALVALGAWLLSGRELSLMLPKPQGGAPTSQLHSMFTYGLAYAIASLSCTIGPFLAVTSQTFRAGSVGQGVLAFLAYGAGMALVVGVLAMAVAVAGSSVVARVRGVLRHINRIAGSLLVLAGAYVTYYGVYEIRLFHFGSGADDPIIGAATSLQEALVSVVDAIGVVPLLVALAVAVLGLVLAGLRKRRASAGTGQRT
ncbi:cytochrome c biogenesis CcdA family protein [Haloechinothrix sp. LS1_15]|uniref:cytochrome c biogenesis CcdA family protein n=1 Tax=Haloechinothrix sp. LS1_15 TaxID=2652248 RepID=UPI00294858D4|nr:cytochrome c biogenesis CcdA family protein [Haloechinothrix sp. LS1_15]MDV6013595.1 cytochrome c biogenesis protein CcdA [Haloechinothrix sp. LS1_15]